MEKSDRGRVEVGYRTGNLTVVSKTDERKNGYTVWLCRCDCGGTLRLDTRTLQRGTVSDCGCVTKVRPGQKDLSGQRFGRLVALEPTRERSAKGSTVWRCRCDCGKEMLAEVTQLLHGAKRSCGCMRDLPLKDIVGQRFGNLTVTGYYGKAAGMHRWACKCDCGKTTIVGQTPLLSGKTRSCGCLRAKTVMENMQFIGGTSVTRLEKNRNRLSRTNSSGYNGVYYNPRSEKWVAQITFKSRTYYLGSFDRLEDAVDMRRKAETQIFGNFLSWYYGLYPEKKQVQSR